MKKVIQKGKPEIAKYYCDKHKDKEVFGELKMNFWYGSKRDLIKITTHLCDDCADDIIDYLKKKFGSVKEEEERF